MDLAGGQADPGALDPAGLFVQRACAAVEYVVEAVDQPIRVTLQSELVANAAMPEQSDDPRVAAVLDSPLQAVEGDSGTAGATLVHRTRVSGLQMAAGMENHVHAPGRVDVETHDAQDWARTTVVTTLDPGQELRLTKFLAYGWSALRSTPALRDQVAGALSGARFTGFAGMLTEQREYLRSSGTPPTSRSRATPRSSRPCGSPCSTSCRPGPAPSSAASPRRA